MQHHNVSKPDMPQDVSFNTIYRQDLVRTMTLYPQRMAQSFVEQSRLVDALFDTSKYLAMLIDVDGIILKMSRFAASVLGYQPAGLVGTDMLVALIAADAAESVTDLIRKARVQGASEGSTIFRTRQGTHLTMDLQISCLTDMTADGRGIPFAYLVSGNIAETAENSLADIIEETSRRMLSSLGEAVLVVKPDSRIIVDCNREAALLFGMPPSTIRGSSLGSLIGSTEDGIDPVDLILDAQAAKGFMSAERRIERHTGNPVQASIMAIPVLGLRGSLERLLVIVKDMSAATQAEREKQFIIGRLKELARSIGELSERLIEGHPCQDAEAWHLTPKQREVARCVLTGQSNKQIAHTLGLTEAAVKVHVHGVYRKFDVRSRLEFMKVARDKGLVF
jgi:PAS domain S-box-containing protein